jgi:hypothetical protein
MMAAERLPSSVADYCAQAGPSLRELKPLEAVQRFRTTLAISGNGRDGLRREQFVYAVGVSYCSSRTDR